MAYSIGYNRNYSNGGGSFGNRTHQGSARVVLEGTYDVRNGAKNKAYCRIVFDDKSTKKRYVVKCYMDSPYTPSSGKNQGKECVPYSVKCFRVGSDGKSVGAVENW